jgi:predicted O-methyltransferase YrrM
MAAGRLAVFKARATSISNDLRYVRAYLGTMIKRSLLPDAVEQYVAQVATKETDIQQRLRRETEKLPNAGMQLGPDQGAFLAWLAKLIGARRALEIGVFTGSSALSVAMVLPPKGQLVACDISEEWTSVGKPYWTEAGVAGKIDLRIGPAAATLEQLTREFGENSFDFAFIDADKAAYDLYYESCLKLVRPGGVLVLDNVLRRGDVADDKVSDQDAQLMRTLNLKIRDDLRVSAVMLTLGDGMTAVRKL